MAMLTFHFIAMMSCLVFIDPNSEILTVSIGAKRILEFVDNADQDKKSLELGDYSVYVMPRHFQNFRRLNSANTC